MNKAIVLLLVAVAASVAVGMSFGGKKSATPSAADGANVEMRDGRQVVTIVARGGYSPAVSTVKAGVPTVLRFKTAGTFDCSSAVSIPAMGIDRSLPPSGTTDIDLGALRPGTLEGTCSMGMFRFALVAM